MIDWATVREPQSTTISGTSTQITGTGGVPVLEEAWAKYRFEGTDIYIRGGQIKDPLAHEQIMSSKYQMSVERSLQDDIFFNGDAFVQGAAIGIADKNLPIRAEVAYTDGLKSSNTNFQDQPGNADIKTNWGAAARVEYKVMGDWSAYDQFTSLRDKNDLLVFGLGGDYTELGHNDQMVFTADAQYATTWGLSLYADYAGRYTQGTLHGSGYEPSVMGQVSYLIANQWEPFGRYEYMAFDKVVDALTGIAAKSNNIQGNHGRRELLLAGTCCQVHSRRRLAAAGHPDVRRRLGCPRPTRVARKASCEFSSSSCCNCWIESTLSGTPRVVSKT